jgi:DsbC/DsbD-like thiol-disulfide interchange protein
MHFAETADRRARSRTCTARWLLAASLACAPAAVRSQNLPEHPVTWKLASPGSVSGRLTAHLDATIADGWHLYSQTQPPAGPVPTSISIVGRGYALVGKPRAPEPERIPDRNFDIISEVYSDSVRVTLTLSRSSPAGDSLRVAVRYQACTNRVCMPPRTDTLAVSGKSHLH